MSDSTPVTTVRFGDIPIGGYFVYRDHLWEKVGERAGLADGYEASNHFAEDCEVFHPKNANGLLNFKDCECKNWCSDGRDMYASHHHNCQHYTPPPPDPRFARFGEAMWSYITKLGGDFCGEEISEDILPLAAAAGLCCRVTYYPEAHGQEIEAERGDVIWWWGDWNVGKVRRAWAGIDADEFVRQVRDGDYDPSDPPMSPS